MLVKKNKRGVLNVFFNASVQAFISSFYSPDKKGGLKKKKLPAQKEKILEQPMSEPLGKLFWFDPILGKN